MSKDEYIGLRSGDEDCTLCKKVVSLPRLANEITMDLLLSRRTPEELLDYFSDPALPFLNGLRLGDLAAHAEHCDALAVPDDYILMPRKYEDGEEHRYKMGKWRQDNSGERT